MICYRTATTAFYLLSANLAFAAPINVADPGNPWELHHFRIVSGSTSAFGQPSGPIDILGFGLTNVVPNGKGEDAGVVVSAEPTTGIARQNGVEVPLFAAGDVVDPNALLSNVPYSQNLSGSWEITLTNGPDQLVLQTPSVEDADVPERVTNVRMLQDTGITTPTITWENNASGADIIDITIFDLNRRNTSTGAADRIHIEGLPFGETSFVIPETAGLTENGKYAFRISTRILRSEDDGTAGTNPSGSSQAGAAIVSGETFFEFTAADFDDKDVILPELTFPGDDTVVFNFNNPVVAAEVLFYDPFVAIGYDYQIGVGDPFFNSFILPEIGDDVFSLHLWNGTEYEFSSDVLAGTEYLLDDQTDRFRILGIETGAALDPTDPNAFVTGLSFVSDGQFTGTMTPISVFVDPAQVPLPAGAALMMTGIAGLGFVRRRRKS